jgi:hypothetical protein
MVLCENFSPCMIVKTGQYSEAERWNLRLRHREKFHGANGLKSFILPGGGI